jgi:hypothetical protein
LLKYPINKFNGNIVIKNEIIIKIKIEEEDINKDVYIKLSLLYKFRWIKT